MKAYYNTIAAVVAAAGVVSIAGSMVETEVVGKGLGSRWEHLEIWTQAHHSWVVLERMKKLGVDLAAAWVALAYQSWCHCQGAPELEKLLSQKSLRGRK